MIVYRDIIEHIRLIQNVLIRSMWYFISELGRRVEVIAKVMTGVKVTAGVKVMAGVKHPLPEG